MIDSSKPPPMPAAGSAFAQLHQYLHHTRLLGSISSPLYYDQNTLMPASRVSLPALPAGTAHHRRALITVHRIGVTPHQRGKG